MVMFDYAQDKNNIKKKRIFINIVQSINIVSELQIFDTNLK